MLALAASASIDKFDVNFSQDVACRSQTKHTYTTCIVTVTYERETGFLKINTFLNLNYCDYEYHIVFKFKLKISFIFSQDSLKNIIK